MTSARSSSKLLRGLLAAFSLAAAACGVSEGGNIPCADDSSCPRDYPVCQAGKCQAGTPAAGSAASAAIVGVDGKSASQPVRGTVRVSASARASSGVKSVVLTGGGKTWQPLASSSAPLYLFDVDTAQLTDGDVAMTAQVTSGDPSVAVATSPAFALHVDNTPPTLTAPATAPDARVGSLVALDVTASEALATLTADVRLGSTSVGPAVEISAPTGLVHHLGFAISNNLATGLYTIVVGGTDLAGNPVAEPISAQFNVRVATPVTALAVANASGVVEAGLPAGSVGSAMNVSLTLPAGFSLPSGGKPVFVVTRPDGSTANLVATGSGLSWSASYTVLAGDTSGLATVSVTVTDSAQNTSGVSRQFLIDKAPASLAGISIDQAFVHVSGAVVVSGVASKPLSSATLTASNGDHVACTCDGMSDCSADTSAAPAISCPVAVSATAAANVTATVSLVDRLGNPSPSSGPLLPTYQTKYSIVPLPVITSFTAGQDTITVGNATTLKAVFSGGTSSVSGNVGSVASNVNVAIAPLADTTYLLTVTSPAGDQVSLPHTVHVVPAPTAGLIANKANVSAGDAVVLTPSLSGGNGVITVSAGTAPPDAVVDSVGITVHPASTTTYTLTVTNAAPNSAIASVTVYVGAIPGVSLGASASSTNAGQSVNLLSNVSNALGASIDPGNISVNANGADSKPVSPTRTTTYTLSAVNSAGQTIKTTTTVVVNPFITSFNADATTVTSGATPVLTVGFSPVAPVIAVTSSTTGPCVAGAQGTNTQQFTCPAISADTKYTVTVTSGTDSDSSSLNVAVFGAPVATSLVANPSTVVAPGASVQLTPTWTTGSGLTAAIDQGVGAVGASGAAGNKTVNPIVTTTYTLTVTNTAGAQATRSVTVVVQPFITSLTAAATAVASGAQPVLTVSFAVSTPVITIPNCVAGTQLANSQQFTCNAIFADTTYIASVTKSGITQTAQLTVTVPPVATATSLVPNPATQVAPGTSVILTPTWTTGNGATASIDNGVGAVAASGAGGAKTVTPYVTTTYTLTTVNAAGVKSSTAVTVPVSAFISSFTAAATSVASGATPSLTVGFTAPTPTVTVASSTTGPCLAGTQGPSSQPFTCPAIGADTTYTVSVTAGGITQTDTLVVSVPAVPTVTSLVPSATPVNPGASVTLTPNWTLASGVTASIDNGVGAVGATGSAGNKTVAPFVTTTYTLTATNAARVSASASATVVVNPFISSFTAVAAAVASGATPSLTVNFTPSSPVITVASSTTGNCVGGAQSASSQSFACPAISADTTYTVSVAAGGITQTDSLVVTVPAPPVATSLTANLTSTTPGTAVTLTPVWTTGAGVTASIDNGVGAVGASGSAGNKTVNPLVTTTYTLTVVNAAGVKSTQSATVNVSPFIAGVDAPLWVTSGGTPSITVSFDVASPVVTVAGVPSSNCTGGAVSGPVSGVFKQTFSCGTFSAQTTYTVTVAKSGVSQSEQHVVGAAPDPTNSPTPVVSTAKAVLTKSDALPISLNFTYCTGCTASFTDGTIVTQLNGATSANVSPSATTTYTLTVVNQAGASANASLKVTVLPGSTALTSAAASKRFGATATLLPNGNVLITGGRTAAATTSSALDTAELWDAGTGAFRALGHAAGTRLTMHARRYQATATLLANGNVLITGGLDETNTALAGADLYDAANEGFVSTAPSNMNVARAGHTATALGDGTVVIAGGTGLRSLELYDGGSPGTFGAGVLAQQLSVNRARHTATLLSDGRVLFLGGHASSLAGEIFEHGSFNSISTVAAILSTPRTNHTATLLSQGNILVVGGAATTAAELVNVLGGTASNAVITGAGSETAGVLRSNHVAIALPGGSVLVAGGLASDGTTVLSGAEIFDPQGGGFNATTSLKAARTEAVGAFLFNGTALIMGGDSSGASAEIFTP